MVEQPNSVSSVSRVLASLSARPELFGVLDYGLSSLATFMVGLFAARTFDPVGLGVYALCFRAVFLGGIVPSQGFFIPAENLVVSLPMTQRLGMMRYTLRRGVPTALASALAVCLWVLLAPTQASPEALAALTATGVALAFLSPIQDHVRRMLHLSGASRVAATVSVVQFLAVGAALLFCSITQVAMWWVPFGTLAFANLVSLAVGVGHASRSEIPAGAPAVLRPEEIRRSGRWLVLLGLLDAGAIFAVAAVVAWISGAAALGYAEAARIAANPVMVLAWGLSSVLGPRSVQAGREKNVKRARHVSRRFAYILAVAGAMSLAIFMADWWGNPMAWLLPNAYIIPGLAGLSILAYLANGFGYPLWWELLGGRLEKSIAKAEIKANVLRTLLAGTAGLTHAYAVPLSLLGFSLARWFAFHRVRMMMYGRAATSKAATLL
jgi:O-antigen/teichoic acid export membrane protein